MELHSRQLGCVSRRTPRSRLDRHFSIMATKRVVPERVLGATLRQATGFGPLPQQSLTAPACAADLPATRSLGLLQEDF